MKKILFFIVLLVFVAVVFAGETVLLPEIFNPETLKVDGDDLFVTQETSVLIYSLENYKLKKKFGRKGQGPGDFQSFKWYLAGAKDIDLTILPDTIFVGSVLKASYFSREGNFIKEKRLREVMMTINVAPLGKGFAARGIKSERDEMKKGKPGLYYTFNILDKEGYKIKEICRYDFPYGVAKKIPQYHVTLNRMFISGKEGLVIDVYDEQGNLEKSIKKDYKKVEFTREDKQRIIKWYQEDPFYRKYFVPNKRRWKLLQDGIEQAGYFPVFHIFLISDGKLFLQTYRIKDDKTEFLVFDLEGKFLKTLYLPLVYEDFTIPHLYTIANGKLYQLVEKADENYMLHITGIEK
jgi:hypothetical protein